MLPPTRLVKLPAFRRPLRAALLVALAIASWWTLRAAFTLLLAQAAHPAEAPPRLAISPNQHDFGPVAAGSQPEHAFQVRNRGSRRLILNRLADECGCLSAAAEIVVPPGHRRPLVARLDTSHFDGPLETTLRYRTNDPRRPVLALRLRADVTASRKRASKTSNLRP